MSPGRPVHHLVAERAATSPDGTAVVCGGTALTYGELDERANRLAHHLVDLGVRVESRVAVCLPRSADSVVALLAVLRAGGAYVPLDPAYPAARLDRMLADARPAVLVTTGGAARPGLVDQDRDAAVIAGRPAHDPGVAVDLANAAYLIFTSGSTGTPKGVLVPHGGLANLVGWHIARYGIGPGEHSAHVASVGFDAAAWEIWPTLAAGATLHIPAEADRHQPDRLLDWLTTSRITVTFLPTPLAEEVLRLPAPRSALRAVLTGGDALTAAPPLGTPYELVNHYGPTEASVVTSAVSIAPGEPGVPPIGWPIEGFRVHLLDGELRPVPDGRPGELCVGGAGLARGYLDRPGLTAERFVPDPAGPPGSRMYRTGDLATKRPDGALEFRGRTDEQLKIRGFRVEPAEVAVTLADHPDVAQAVVVGRTDSRDEIRLVGYLVPRAEPPGHHRVGAELVAAVRGHAAERLPAHMVPSAIVVLDAIPVTPNGKVDRDALPDPFPPAPAEVVPPRDDLEELIADSWYGVLDLTDRPVHVHDDFFVLGGHSLLATKLTVRLKDLLGVELPMQVTLRAPTIAALAGEIRSREPVPGHLAAVTSRHRLVASLSDEEVERMLAELGEG